MSFRRWASNLDCGENAHRFPCTLAIRRATHGLVQEHQVDVVEICERETLVNGCLGFIVADIDDFGSEEYLVARDGRRANRVAAASFVLVHRGRVNLCLLLEIAGARNWMARSRPISECLHGGSQLSALRDSISLSRLVDCL